MDTDEKHLGHIEEISKNARATWFSLLAALLFCGITLLDVQDRDFFEYGAATKLPLIGVEVPVVGFFLSAPVLVLALYLYLHIYLAKLWRALASPFAVEGAALDDRVYPWLLSDAALRLRPDAQPRDFAWLSTIVSLALGWAFAPFIIAVFWVRSWPYHHEWLTLFLAALLLVSLWMAFRSYTRMRDWMIRKGAASVDNPTDFLRFALIPLTASGAIILGIVSWQTTEGPLYPKAWGKLAGIYPADLYRLSFVQLPDDWESRDLAWQSYSLKYRDTIIAEIVRNPKTSAYAKRLNLLETEIRKRLYVGFRARRTEKIKRLPKKNWNMADLRNADLREVNLTGIDLRNSQLEGAQLTGAQMEEVDLRGADMKGVNFTNTQMEEAKLQNSKMDKINFSNAQMRRVNLEGAQINLANFSGAQMEETNFKDANMKMTDFSLTWMKGVNFEGIQMKRGSFFMAQIQDTNFKKSIISDVDFSGIIARKSDFEEALIQYSSFLGANVALTSFRKANLEYANFREANIHSTNFRKAKMKHTDFREAVVQKSSFEFAQMKNSIFIEARAKEVNFNNSQMTGANFYKSLIINSNFKKSTLDNTFLMNSVFKNTDVRGASFNSALFYSNTHISGDSSFSNLSDAKGLEQSMIDQMFGNMSTRLPETLKRPAHWASERLNWNESHQLYCTWLKVEGQINQFCPK